MDLLKYQRLNKYSYLATKLGEAWIKSFIKFVRGSDDLSRKDLRTQVLSHIMPGTGLSLCEGISGPQIRRPSVTKHRMLVTSKASNVQDLAFTVKFLLI